jgi:subfamily B ATP-binding cassette protein MsbA
VRALGFLLRYTRRYRHWGILALGATVAYAVASVVILFLFDRINLELITGSVSTGSAVVGAAAPTGGGDGMPVGAVVPRLKNSFRQLLTPAYERVRDALGVTPEGSVYFLPILFALAFILRSVSDFANGYAFQHLGLGATADLREDLYRRTLLQTSRFHADHPSGELVSRVVNDVGVLQSAITMRLVDLIQQPATLLLTLAALFTMNARLTLICLVAAPVVVFPIVRFGKGMRKSSHRSQERTADLAMLVAESARGQRVVKAFGMEDFESRRFHEATQRHLRVNLKAQYLANLSSPVIESLGAIGAALLLIYVGRQIRAGAMDPAALFTFLMALYTLYDPIRKLNKANIVVQQSLAAAQRVKSLMEIPIEIAERPGARAIAAFEREVRYDDVVFSYDHLEVLRGVSLLLRRGEMVALVGPSGGGKTTLANLLPRFFDVTGGSVSIDGVDVRDLKLADLRALVGLVTQETVLFNDTVRNNIAYGREELALDRVRAAALAAYADDFVMQLPQGYDTVVGEGGVRLSGGQRQRLAIARALLKNAPILILDEATSQLDTESEALVQQALANLMQGRTTLVIAHRLSTIRRVDRICVVDSGRIVEQGRHDELLALDGVYKRLYELQFQDE